MQRSQDLDWPRFSLTKYMIRVLYASKAEERTAAELSEISGYTGGTYQIKLNILQRLEQEELLQCNQDLYSITEKGEKVLSSVLDFRDVEVLDARDLEKTGSSVAASEKWGGGQ